MEPKSFPSTNTSSSKMYIEETLFLLLFSCYAFCPIVCILSITEVLWYPLWFPHENGAWLVFLTICFVREVQALFMLFVFIYVY
jgi:hypothetical protein